MAEIATLLGAQCRHLYCLINFLPSTLMSGKCPKATEKKLPSCAWKPSVKAKTANEAASDSETTKPKKTPRTKGRGKKAAEPAEDSSDGEEDEQCHIVPKKFFGTSIMSRLWHGSLGERGWYFQIKLYHIVVSELIIELPMNCTKKVNGQSTQTIHWWFTVMNLCVNCLLDRLLNCHVWPLLNASHLVSSSLSIFIDSVSSPCCTHWIPKRTQMLISSMFWPVKWQPRWKVLWSKINYNI